VSKGRNIVFRDKGGEEKCLKTDALGDTKLNRGVLPSLWLGLTGTQHRQKVRSKGEKWTPSGQLPKQSGAPIQRSYLIKREPTTAWAGFNGRLGVTVRGSSGSQRKGNAVYWVPDQKPKPRKAPLGDVCTIGEAKKTPRRASAKLVRKKKERSNLAEPKRGEMTSHHRKLLSWEKGDQNEPMQKILRPKKPESGKGTPPWSPQRRKESSCFQRNLAIRVKSTRAEKKLPCC